MSGMIRERRITCSVKLPASIDAVWDAWTTPEGIHSFFAPSCNIDIRVGGLYEILFDLEAQPGDRGSEGMHILALQPGVMLSFTWNAPPELQKVRSHYTHVTVRFHEVSKVETEVSLIHDGFGEGGEWEQTFRYFVRAWKKVVLPRLKYRFVQGPLDWDNLPDLSKIRLP
jgi:uncharacterized protein YndB with AHSA1/START domain